MPGGAAGKPSHEAIFERELESADAIILVAGSPRLKSDLVTPIFKKVLEKVVKKKPEIASEMIFLVATYWDNANSALNIQRAVNALDDLMRGALPKDYKKKHQENPYYRMRALDAFFATMYILGKENDPEVGSDQQKKDYLSRVLAANEALRNLFQYRDLPEVLTLDGITMRHHQAMLELSNLHVLERDLQKFLAESRFTIQLVAAKTALQRAIQQISALAWAEVRKYYPLINEDLEELIEKRNHEQAKRMSQYEEEIKYRKNSMKTAWEDAVKASLKNLDEQSEQKNNFLNSLKQAYEQATEWVERHIENGDFSGSEFFDTNKLTHRNVGQLVSDKVRKQAIKGNLLPALRTSFWLAIEHEIRKSALESPAVTLAQTFLAPLGELEQNNGPLNIGYVSVDEIDRYSDIQKRYNKIKQDVREIACESCLSLTMSALLYHSNALDDQKHQSVMDLDNCMQGVEESVDEKILVKNVLKEMVKNIVSDIQLTIITLFHHKLAKFCTYDKVANDGRVVQQDGEFVKLVDDIYNRMRDLLKEEQRVQQKFDAIFAKHDQEINYWQGILAEAEAISRGDNLKGVEDVR